MLWTFHRGSGGFWLGVLQSNIDHAKLRNKKAFDVHDTEDYLFVNICKNNVKCEIKNTHKMVIYIMN